MGNYQLILADPPWSYDNKASRAAADDHYSTMTLKQLLRLPVEDIASESAVLALWYTGNFTKEAFALAEAWGFKVRTAKLFTWVKLNQLAEQHINKAIAAGNVQDYFDFLTLLNAQTRIGMGNYTRANTEDCLIAVRGDGLERMSASIRQVIYSPLGEHSAKPAEARLRLEELYGDVKRIELFARDVIPGWHSWGNHNPHNDIELVPAGFAANDNQPHREAV